MQMHDFVRSQDQLSSEDILYNIPVRKEYVLGEIGRGRRVLDVGCLGGQFSEQILAQNNEVYGAELNPDAAAAAQARGIRVKIANVEEGLPFEDGFFDVVHAGELIKHLYDTKSFFIECHRVLKENGIFIFTTPNLNSLENRLRVLTGGYLAMTGAYPEDHFGHSVRHFNLNKLRELSEQTGFELEKIRGIATYQPHGKLLDAPLGLAARFMPGLSKLLIVTARKKKI